MNKENLIAQGKEILKLIHPILIPLFGDESRELGVRQEDIPKVREWVKDLRLFSLKIENKSIIDEFNELKIYDQHNRVNKDAILLVIRILELI